MAVRVDEPKLVDGMPRDEAGFWQPEGGAAPPNPLFAWPPRPWDALKWLYNYLFPWNLIYMGVATVTWLYWQPALSRCAEFRPDWILEMFIRNELLLIGIVSAWHLRFWSLKRQGLKYKYTPDWMAVGNRKFMWGNQLRDNVFWSCVSGGIIWTAYEVLMMWAYANEMVPYVDPRAASRCGDCSISIGHTASHTGHRSTGRLTIFTTRTSTSDHGRACPCTRSSTSFTSAPY